VIRLPDLPGGDEMHAVVIVAFDPTTGEIHGTFVHGSLGDIEPSALELSESRFRAEVADRVGADAVIAAIRVPLSSFTSTWIDRVDPQTLEPLFRAAGPTSISRP